MPMCPKCGQVVDARDGLSSRARDDRVHLREERGRRARCGFSGEQSVLGGKAKVRWKVDWALRWYVLKVDYELYGKDLTDSARLSGQI